jgi:uroporphyrinogen-III decarboxylase
MMTSRQRVQAVLNRQEPDRVPIGLCECSGIGIHAITIYRLRQALGLDSPGTGVKVVEPFVMIGEIKPDLMQALGCDIVAVREQVQIFGRGGGYIFAAVHNIQALVPIENLLAMFETVRTAGQYSMKCH